MPKHQDIVDDSFLHEPKGAGSAVLNTVVTSNGDGTTSFSTVSYNNLTDTPTIPNVPSTLGYVPILSGFSTASSQEPSGTDNPLQVEFGAGSITTDATLSSGGTVTINTDGLYAFANFLRFGRTSNTGTAILFNRFLINDVQTAASNVFSLSESSAIIPFSATVFLELSAGDTLKFEIYRDSSGSDDGGLFESVPTLAGWNNSTSSTLVIYRFGGLST